jgi:small-conductance mechanosensitive channel
MIETLSHLPPWGHLALLGLLALLLALLAHRIGRRIVFRIARHAQVLDAVVHRLDRPLQWVLPLVALQLVWQGAPDEMRAIDSVRHLNGILLIAAVTWAAIGAVQGVADAMARLHPADVADNLHARRLLTQTRVLSRTASGLILFAGLAMILMTFPRARQLGASLLASAGVAGLVAGIAARSVFSNLLAGLQIALAQPLRIDDVLIVEGEWGRVEEITGTYVVLKLWDERRLIVPLQWFIEHPFQNWTRTTAQIVGSVFLWVDYRTDVDAVRAEAKRLVATSSDWDQRVCVLQVVETSERAMQLRLIVSSGSSGQNWDLRCFLREGLIRFLKEHQPEALPRVHAELHRTTTPPATPPTGATGG